MESGEKRQGKILVVDDEEPVGRLLQQWLEDEGYQVEYARDSSEAAERLGCAAFDLVTLDIMMPGMDGLKLLDWIRQEFPETGVVMATALDQLDTVLAAMRAGAVNYLIKPFNMELVSEEIARAMERQRLVAENRAYQQELEERVEERTRALEEARRQLERKVRELEGRDRLIQLQISPPGNLQEACVEILGIVERVLEAASVSIFRRDEEGNYLMAGKQMGEAVPDGQERRLTAGEGRELVDRVFATGQSLSGTRGEMAVPILYRREALGVLWVEGIAEEGLDQLWNLSREAALVLRMVQMTTALERNGSEIDELLLKDEAPAVGEY